MKKPLQILSSVVLSAAFVGGLAGATPCAGSITNTGPGSNNGISCDETTNTNVMCTNGMWVASDNNQNAGSGDAEGSGNTSSGGATSGSTNNDNNQNVKINTSCDPAATPANMRSVPGKGGAEPTAKSITALPDTADNSVLTLATISVASVAVVLAASRLGIATYRRLSNS